MTFAPRFALLPALAKSTWGRHNDRPLAGGSDALAVPVARNAVTGVQVRVAADADFVLVTDHANWLHRWGLLPRVRLDVRFLTLPADAVERLVVGWVESDDHFEWMEVLDPSGHAESPARRPAVAYLRIRVPRDVATGVHEGSVTAWVQQGLEAEVATWTGSIRLDVAEPVLPDPSAWRFRLDLWQHLTSVALHHRVPLWSEAHLALVDRYYASLAELGQKAVTIVATEVPWVGQFAYRGRRDVPYYFEHSPIAVTRDATGALAFDFTVLDRLLDLASRHGIDDVIEVFGLLHPWTDEPFGFGRVLDGVSDARIRVLEPDGSIGYMRSLAEFAAFVSALRDHFVDRGVVDRVRIAADEPGESEPLDAELAFLRAAAPELRYSVAVSSGRVLETLPDDFLDCCAALAEVGRFPAFADRVRDRGGSPTFYTCGREPFPNTFVHSPLVESALMGWIADALGLDGYLRWAYCLWPADPWHRMTTAAANPPWSAGDTSFVMPGPAGGPMTTLRYEALRLGIQDFELLRSLRDRGTPDADAAVQAAHGRIFRQDVGPGMARIGSMHEDDPTTVRRSDLYSLDPADVDAARGILLAALEARP